MAIKPIEILIRAKDEASPILDSVDDSLNSTGNSVKKLGTDAASAVSGIDSIAAAEKKLADDLTKYGLASKEVSDASAALGAAHLAVTSAITTQGTASVTTTTATTGLANALESIAPAAKEASADMRSAGKAGEESAAKINSAWKTLGVRSFAQTQAEIAKVKTALDTVKSSGASPIEVKLATESAQAKIKELEGGVNSVGAAATSATGLLRQLGPMFSGVFGAQQFIQTIVAAESLSRSYEQVFGSMAAARTEMGFVKDSANLLGVETLDLAKSYQQLAASTKGTAIEGQATRDVFLAVTRAMATMGKSSAETNLALNAVSQMASKGQVAMEELRGQLGESLPGALKAAADGAGLTTEQLIAMVSAGDVLAKDLLPALAKGLNDLYAKAPPPETVVSEWARFKNVITETATAIGEGGASKGIAKGLTGAAEAAKYAALGVDILGTAIGEGIAALVTWNGTLTTSQDLGANYGITKVGEAQATDKATAAIKSHTAAQQDDAKATAKVVESALSVQAAYSELAKNAETYVAAVLKQNEAKAAESKVLTSLVDLYGTELEKRQATTAAAVDQAAQYTQLAAAQNAQLEVAKSYVAKLQERAAAEKDTTQATQDAIAAAQKQVQGLQAAFDKTKALTDAKTIDVAASKAQELALKDNSSRLSEYRGAVGQAKVEVERLTAAHEAGKATDEQVRKAKTDLATATLLYRDALKDTEDAFHKLGIKTPDELNKIAAANKAAWDRVSADTRVSTADMQKAFTTYAESAIAANNGVATDTLKAEAAMRGLQVQSGATGDSIVSGMTDAAGSVSGLTRNLEAAAGAYLALKNAAYEATSDKGKALMQESTALRKDGQHLAAGFAQEQAKWADASQQSKTDQETWLKNSRSQMDIVPNFTSLGEAQVWHEKWKQQQRQAYATSMPDSSSLARAVDSWTESEYRAEVNRLKGQKRAQAIDDQAGTDAGGNTPTRHVYTVNINDTSGLNRINVSSDADARNLISVLQRYKLSS